ncbi:hypothetical protein BJ170DRAFT_366107 [Xylariales sp. AK1849]|nr:hypothetical protein BJ170DRAFT_366107 [Xylariales sp. AK1849]
MSSLLLTLLAFIPGNAIHRTLVGRLFDVLRIQKVLPVFRSLQKLILVGRYSTIYSGINPVRPSQDTVLRRRRELNLHPVCPFVLGTSPPHSCPINQPSGLPCMYCAKRMSSRDDGGVDHSQEQQTGDYRYDEHCICHRYEAEPPRRAVIYVLSYHQFSLSGVLKRRGHDRI